MKVIILGDTHFGMRGDSIHFHKLYSNFYNKTLFPYMRENNITKIFQLGDLFDRRKYINFQTLFLCRNYFFNQMLKENIEFYTLLGNHDIAFKNTLTVNSSTQLLDSYKNITVYDSPVTVTLDGTAIDIIPWICKENLQEINAFIENSASQICFGHFELAGFEMDRGNICHDGMQSDFLNKYDLVFSGHFHHKSFNGNILYVGSPGEMTWADYNDKRGFHVFDTTTREIEFIENPHRMFFKTFYDDSNLTVEDINKLEFKKYADKIIKVVVECKNDPYLFEMYLDKLYSVTPLNVLIVEDFIDYSEISEQDVVDQADDTITILDKFIENMETNLNKEKLKNVLREVYNNALSVETI
jgi:DNA repair exonuclease SbcCD nuclease subunit